MSHLSNHAKQIRRWATQLLKENLKLNFMFYSRKILHFSHTFSSKMYQKTCCIPACGYTFTFTWPRSSKYCQLTSIIQVCAVCFPAVHTAADSSGEQQWVWYLTVFLILFTWFVVMWMWWIAVNRRRTGRRTCSGNMTVQSEIWKNLVLLPLWRALFRLNHVLK